MVKATTNNVPRPLLTRDDLTSAERKRYAPHDTLTEDVTLFRYKGEVYNLDEFPRLLNGLNGDGDEWQAGMALTVWSGVVIRLVKVDGDTMVVVGTYSE